MSEFARNNRQAEMTTIEKFARLFDVTTDEFIDVHYTITEDDKPSPIIITLPPAAEALTSEAQEKGISINNGEAIINSDNVTPESIAKEVASALDTAVTYRGQGGVIKAWLKRKGMKQSDLCAELLVSNTYVSNMVNDVKTIPASIMDKMVKVFGCKGREELLSIDL
jgi:DNA-binding Xre family transcriptional regulator